MIIVFITLANLRGHQGVGPPVRVPDLRLHRHPHRDGVPRAHEVRGSAGSAASSRSRSTSTRRSRTSSQTGGTLSLFILLRGLLVGRGRADRCRGDLQRRARVPPTGVEERGHDARVDGDDPRHAVPRRVDPRPPPAAVSEREGHGVRADGQAGVRRQRRVLVPAARDRRRSSRSPRTPRTPTSRGCRRSSPATATCRGSSRTAATGSCSPTASSCSRAWPRVLIVAFGGKTNALIPLYAVGVFISFTLSQAGMVRAPPDGARAALEARRRDQRRRLVRDRGRHDDHRRRRSSRRARGSRSSSSR